MKKTRLLFIMVFVVMLMATMYACNPGDMTIKFDSNGGTPVSSIGLEKGVTEFTFPTNPTKPGNTFVDWYLDIELTQKADIANVMAKFVDKVTEVTLYAKWTPVSTETITYTISFNSGEGGSAVANISVAEEATIFTMPAAPTKTGNDFAGWYLESGLTTAATVENVLTALTPTATTITLYAKWTPVTYTISFNSGDGSAVADISVAFGATAFTMPEIPTKADNDFVGWYLESGFTTAATVENVLTALTPAARTITLYANWTPITYTISFNSGDGGSAVADITVAHDATTFTMPEIPTKADNDFVGWYLESAFATAATVENVLAALSHNSRTITLYAMWTPSVTYNISYVTDGGSTVEPSIFPEGTEIFVFPTEPTKTDFIFLGWYLDAEFETAATAENVLEGLTEEDNTRTLYAKWRDVIIYTVIFNTDGGTPVDSINFPETAMAFELPLEEDVERGDNFFDGWFINQELTTPATEENVLALFGEENTVVNIYLKWMIPYYIHFYVNYPDYDISSLAIRTDAETFDIPDVDIGYYAFFEGWYFVYHSEEKEGTVDNILESLNENERSVSLEARISPAWLVLFNTQGGTDVTTIRLPSGAESFDFPAAPTRPGSTFDGWYLEEDTQTVANVANVLALISEPDYRVTVYAKWTLSPEIQAYYAAKDELFDAMLYAFDETRGKELEEALSPEDSGELNSLINEFGINANADEPYYSTYEEFLIRLKMQSYYAIYDEYMTLFNSEEPDITRMDDIFNTISELKEVVIPWYVEIPNYYQRLNELRQEEYLYDVCLEYLTLYNTLDRDQTQQDQMDADFDIIYSSNAYNYIGIYDFAVYFTTDADPIFSTPEEQVDAQRYVTLLRKAFEYDYYVEAKDAFDNMMTRVLNYLYGEEAITIDKIEALTAALNAFDYSTMTFGQQEDGGTYYYPNPQGMLDGLLYIIGDALWSTDDVGILLHKYMSATFSISIEQSPDLAQELIAQRDSITEQFTMDFAEIVIGLMEIVQENDIIGNLYSGMNSSAEMAAAISSVSAALIDFTTQYTAEQLDGMVLTIVSLFELVPEESSSLLGIIQSHLILSKLGEVLALVDQTMIDSIFVFEEGRIIQNEDLAFGNENLAIFEAKALCVLYGEDYNAAEFSASYDDSDIDLFSTIINLVITAILQGPEPELSAPMNRSDPIPSFLFSDPDMLLFVGSNVLKDMLKEQICISDERYNAIKAIALKQYDAAPASETPGLAPVTPEEIDNLIIIRLYNKFQEIKPEIGGIYNIFGIIYEDQDQQETEDAMGEVSMISLFLALNDIDLAKIQNFKYMLEEGIANQMDLDISYRIEPDQLLYIIYSLLTAYNDGTETEYTPFTSEEAISLLTYLFEYMVDYKLSSEEAPELIAALQALAANDYAYVDDITFMAVKFIELFVTDLFAEEGTGSPMVYALNGLKAYYADNEIVVPEDAVVAAFELLKTLGALNGDDMGSPENEAEYLSESFAIVELVIGNEKYNSFDEVIGLLIAVAEESDTLAAFEGTDEYYYDHEDYYSDHNFIKTLVIVFGEDPKTDFADVVALAGEDTPCARVLSMIFENYGTISTWAAAGYDYANNSDSLRTDLGVVINDIRYEMYQIFPFFFRRK